MQVLALASSRQPQECKMTSSGAPQVRFTASWGAPREFPESIPKEVLRKIRGTNTGEIKETSRSHSVLNKPRPSNYPGKLSEAKEEELVKPLDPRILRGKH